jgi:hypothetical protein
VWAVCGEGSDIGRLGAEVRGRRRGRDGDAKVAGGSVVGVAARGEICIHVCSAGTCRVVDVDDRVAASPCGRQDRSFTYARQRHRSTIKCVDPSASQRARSGSQRHDARDWAAANLRRGAHGCGLDQRARPICKPDAHAGPDSGGATRDGRGSRPASSHTHARASWANLAVPVASAADGHMRTPREPSLHLRMLRPASADSEPGCPRAARTCPGQHDDDAHSPEAGAHQAPSAPSVLRCLRSQQHPQRPLGLAPTRPRSHVCLLSHAALLSQRHAPPLRRCLSPVQRCCFCRGPNLRPRPRPPPDPPSITSQRMQSPSKLSSTTSANSFTPHPHSPPVQTPPKSHNQAWNPPSSRARGTVALPHFDPAIFHSSAHLSFLPV